MSYFISRRLQSSIPGLWLAILALGFTSGSLAQENPYADPAEPDLPQTEMSASLANTALVITDPQIGFLSPDGVTWGVVGESVQEQGTVANIGKMLDAAKKVVANISATQ